MKFNASIQTGVISGTFFVQYFLSVCVQNYCTLAWDRCSLNRIKIQPIHQILQSIFLLQYNRMKPIYIFLWCA